MYTYIVLIKELNIKIKEVDFFFEEMVRWII